MRSVFYQVQSCQFEKSVEEVCIWLSQQYIFVLRTLGKHCRWPCDPCVCKFRVLCITATVDNGSDVQHKKSQVSVAFLLWNTHCITQNTRDTRPYILPYQYNNSVDICHKLWDFCLADYFRTTFPWLLQPLLPPLTKSWLVNLIQCSTIVSQT